MQDDNDLEPTVQQPAADPQPAAATAATAAAPEMEEPHLKSAVSMTTDVVLIGVAIAIPLISWFYIPFGGDSHWFGRSGTIMAIIGIVLESRLFASKLIMNQLSHIPRKKKGGRYVMSKTTAILSHFILISGAIISGYGDLIFREIKLGM